VSARGGWHAAPQNRGVFSGFIPFFPPARPGEAKRRALPSLIAVWGGLINLGMNRFSPLPASLTRFGARLLSDERGKPSSANQGCCGAGTTARSTSRITRTSFARRRLITWSSGASTWRWRR